MKQVYCSICGTPIQVHRKAIKSLGQIVDIIDPHECLDEPQEFDLTPLPYQPFELTEEKKFVKELDDLRPPPPMSADLRDRRPTDQVKSTAPDALIDQIMHGQNTIPARPMVDPLSETEPDNE